MFLFHDQAPVHFSDPLPDAVDCVVIGAGVIGISTAWYLREKGLSVLVCDKGRVAGEQSSRNWGWVRVTLRDEAEVPIAIDSQACWQALQDELGEGIGFKRAGIAFLADTEAAMADLESWLPIAQTHGLDTRRLGASEATRLIGGLATPMVGGVHTPTDARAEPFTAVRTLAEGLQARGGLIREGCAARTVEFQNGAVHTVVTELGAVRTDTVVCATGAWSNLMLGNLGLDLPQLAVRATVARTGPVDNVWDGAVGLGDFFMRRRRDGGYTVTSELIEHLVGPNSLRYFNTFSALRKQDNGTLLRLGGDATQGSFLGNRWSGDSESPFERHRVLNPMPSQKVLKEIRHLMGKRLPGMADTPFAQTWAGMIDATPDLVPVMDHVPGHDGLFVATGFSGHGFGIGPAAGRIMARMITGTASGFDLERFRFSRFSDGSEIRPGPAI